MSLVRELNLTTNIKPLTNNPIIKRRDKLVVKINQQIANLTVLLTGRKVKDVFGGRNSSNWYWLDESGNYFLSIFYGKKCIELSKNKFSISCSDLEDVKNNLLIVKDYVLKGEFDSQLSSITNQIRKNFKK